MKIFNSRVVWLGSSDCFLSSPSFAWSVFISPRIGTKMGEGEALLGILPICSSPLLSSYIGFLLLLLLFFNISTFPFYPPSNQINPKGLFTNLKSKMLYPSMKLIWLQCHKNPYVRDDAKYARSPVCTYWSCSSNEGPEEDVLRIGQSNNKV